MPCGQYKAIFRIGTLPQSWILLAERSQSVIYWRSLIRLIRLIRLITSIRLIRLIKLIRSQWRGLLHSYMWMGWDWMDGWMVIIGRRLS